MKDWIQRSFRNRILISVLLITILPLLVCSGLVLEIQVSRSGHQQRLRAERELSACAARLEDYCGEAEAVCQRLGESTVVRSVLRRQSLDSRILYQVLLRETGTLREIARADVYLPDGSCGYSTRETGQENLDSRWGILRAAAQSENVVYRGLDAGEGGFRLAKAVRDFRGNILGFVAFTMEQEGLDALFDGCFGTSQDLLLLSRFWEPLYGTRPSAMAADAAELRTRLLAGEAVSGWSDGNLQTWLAGAVNGTFQLVLQQPVLFTSGVLRTFLRIGIAAGLVCAGLCVIYALWLSRNLSQPVHQLEQAMEQAEKGDLTVCLDLNRRDELGRLSQSFNRMIQEQRENLERSVRNQRELNEARIRMMQAQLNPHFLYNTLDSVKWLGVTNHVPDVAELATNLAQLLRVSISAREFLTLQEELEMVEWYVEIQQIRLADRFSCEIDVEEQFQYCRIPKMVLQPLVENAIIHGVADCEEGYIKLTAARDGADLIVSVTDNGCGVSQEALDRLQENRRHAHVPEGHLGLYNVDQILRLYYGDSYGVWGKNLAGGGSCFWLRIPLEIQERGGTEDC